ncbi:MAG: ArsR family transcriptional regulator [Acidobacteria bacterium]|nr:ArsR family transcriptional regulator [Acidobacteriota bacterium]
MSPLLDALRALAEPTRLRLLAICAHAELTVTELTRVLGQSQPRVSRHLKLLCDAGVLERFREQTFAYFRMARQRPGRDIAQAILKLVPEDDSLFLLDRSRVDEELQNRAREADAIMQQLERELATARKEQPPIKDIESAVNQILGTSALGELLEIGTGTGGMLQYLAKRATHAVGIDISPQMLRVARAQIQQAGIADHVAVRLGDMHHLHFPNQSFDTICLDRVLIHADEPTEVIGEISRLLRPHGRVVIIERLGENGMDPVALRAWFNERSVQIGEARTVQGPRIDLWVACGNKQQTSAGVA